MNFQDAVDLCQSDESHLVKIDTAEKYNFINNYIAGKEIKRNKKLIQIYFE